MLGSFFIVLFNMLKNIRYWNYSYNSSKHIKKDLHVLDYELSYPKNELKDLIQLNKKRNQITNHSRDILPSFPDTTHT